MISIYQVLCWLPGCQRKKEANLDRLYSVAVKYVSIISALKFQVYLIFFFKWKQILCLCILDWIIIIVLCVRFDLIKFSMVYGFLFLERYSTHLVHSIRKYINQNKDNYEKNKCQNFWLIFFPQTLTCYNDPDSHPFVTEKELDYLKKEMGQTKRNDDLPPTPWMAILTSVPVFALICAQVIVMQSIWYQPKVKLHSYSFYF